MEIAPLFKFLFAGVLVWAQCQYVAAQKPPMEQVHISLGTLSDEMIVTWHTLVDGISDQARVEFGTDPGNLNQKANAETTYFKGSDGSEESVLQLFTYRARMGDLQPTTVYYYRVGSPASSWSRTFQFKSLQAGHDWMPRVLVIGDLGWQNQESLPHLEKEAEQLGNIDAVFHIGDFAYDLQDRQGKKGNEYMKSIENLVSKVPYQALPGNHERHQNFTHYDARFTMIGDYLNPDPSKSLISRMNNHYHSEDYGPMHVIQLDTEFYYYANKNGWDMIRYQYEWLELDLKKANANRHKTPWILVFGHRPMYCLRLGDNESCDHNGIQRAAIRAGIHYKDKKDEAVQYGLEELCYKYGVDLFIFAHEHYYARLHPVYDHEIHANHGETIADAMAPLHITSGCAGNRELHPAFNPNPKSNDYVRTRTLDYGYGKIVFENRLKFTWEETSIDKGNEVIDRVTITKKEDQPAWKRG